MSAIELLGQRKADSKVYSTSISMTRAFNWSSFLLLNIVDFFYSYTENDYLQCKHPNQAYSRHVLASYDGMGGAPTDTYPTVPTWTFAQLGVGIKE